MSDSWWVPIRNKIEDDIVWGFNEAEAIVAAGAPLAKVAAAFIPGIGTGVTAVLTGLPLLVSFVQQLAGPGNGELKSAAVFASLQAALDTLKPVMTGQAAVNLAAIQANLQKLIDANIDLTKAMKAGSPPAISTAVPPVAASTAPGVPKTDPLSGA